MLPIFAVIVVTWHNLLRIFEICHIKFTAATVMSNMNPVPRRYTKHIIYDNNLLFLGDSNCQTALDASNNTLYNIDQLHQLTLLAFLHQ